LIPLRSLFTKKIHFPSQKKMINLSHQPINKAPTITTPIASIIPAALLFFPPLYDYPGITVRIENPLGPIDPYFVLRLGDPPDLLTLSPPPLPKLILF
jgi:hypothetical protein